MPSWKLLPEFVPKIMTTAERDAKWESPPNALTIYNSDLGMYQVYSGIRWVSLPQYVTVAATTAPGVGDDTDDGYVIGDRWLDVTADEEYVALDVTVGSAVWKRTTRDDAGDLTYTPAVATDWDGDADPGDMDDALDQLAERIDDTEALEHAQAHAPESHTGQGATAAELETLTDTSDADALHDHGNHGVTHNLYSVHTYVFVPDAAKGVDIAIGDQQSIVHHSGDNNETVIAWGIDAETAPTGASLNIQLEFGNTDDLDDVASWTEIDAEVLAISAKSVKFTGSFTNATITANRLIRMNVDQVGSTVAGQDGSVWLRVKRPLVT
ncbi:hypothetical protein LCGC14_0511180 [marine sediment metagenome]|uniref:Uncharacterized protein n=1 Tax=marine sediment metagenome TaxID=412755 RepID=A0A0F9SJK4_9ZZZZ